MSCEPHWEAAAAPDSPQAQVLPGPPIANMFFVAFGRSAFMGARSTDPERVRELIPIIQGPVLGGVPGTFAIVQQSSLFQRATGSGRSIDIEITGPDLGRLLGLGGRIFGQVRQVVPGAQARPIPSLDLGNPEVRILPDRVRAADLGLSARDIGSAVNALLDGALVDGYQFQGEEIDLVLRGEEDWFRTQDIEALPIYTPRGQLVPLSAVARVEVTTGPEQINHIERSRAITVQVIPPETIALETVLDDIQTQIVQPLVDSGELAPPYQIQLSGSADDLRRTRQALQWNFLLALVITYLLMAALFESFPLPIRHHAQRTAGAGWGHPRAGGRQPHADLSAARHPHHARLRHPHRRGGQQRHPHRPPDAQHPARRARNASQRGHPRRGFQPRAADFHVHDYQRLGDAAASRLSRRGVRAV